MRIFIICILLTSFRCFSYSETNCQIVSGIYQNSGNQLIDLKFSTVVDIFTLNNANTLSMNLDSEELKFLRSDMSVGKQTKMTYLYRKNGEAVRTAHITIDRSPKDAASNRHFYGNLIISKLSSQFIQNINNIVYNFYCTF